MLVSWSQCKWINLVFVHFVRPPHPPQRVRTLFHPPPSFNFFQGARFCSTLLELPAGFKFEMFLLLFHPLFIFCVNKTQPSGAVRGHKNSWNCKNKQPCRTRFVYCHRHRRRCHVAATGGPRCVSLSKACRGVLIQLIFPPFFGALLFCFNVYSTMVMVAWRRLSLARVPLHCRV